MSNEENLCVISESTEPKIHLAKKKLVDMYFYEGNKSYLKSKSNACYKGGQGQIL